MWGIQISMYDCFWRDRTGCSPLVGGFKSTYAIIISLIPDHDEVYISAYKTDSHEIA